MLPRTVSSPSSQRSVANASIEVTMEPAYTPGAMRSRRRSVHGLWPAPRLQDAVIGLFDDLLHHLHVAGGESSVNRKYGARDPGGLVRCEEEGGSGHILRLTNAAQRIPFGDSFKDVGILLPSVFPGRRS